LRDLTTILARRYPPARVVIVPTLVQGEEAPASIARSLEIAGGLPGVEVIILGRGGGSMEDLWAFNDERVVRAIFASARPVISAVGHETDFTLADFVADARAATPSMAAEMAVPDREELLAALQTTGSRLRAALRARLRHAHERLQRAVRHPVLLRPQALMQQRQVRLDEAVDGLVRGMQARLERQRARFERAAVALEALSPAAVVGRGYAICQRKDGSVVRRISEVEIGEEVGVTVSDGELGAQVLTRTGRQVAPGDERSG
jgi:exodeoxyribonuclease VII large subunit